jgi:hypothetical protein
VRGGHNAQQQHPLCGAPLLCPFQAATALAPARRPPAPHRPLTAPLPTPPRGNQLPWRRARCATPTTWATAW